MREQLQKQKHGLEKEVEGNWNYSRGAIEEIDRRDRRDRRGPPLWKQEERKWALESRNNEKRRKTINTSMWKGGW